MSKKQSRRTVSISRRIFEAAKALAERTGRSMSRIVEDQLLEALADPALTAAAQRHRESERLRTTPRKARP